MMMMTMMRMMRMMMMAGRRRKEDDGDRLGKIQWINACPSVEHTETGSPGSAEEMLVVGFNTLSLKSEYDSPGGVSCGIQKSAFVMVKKEHPCMQRGDYAVIEDERNALI